MTATAPSLLTIAEVASRLAVSPRTVSRLIAAGHLRAHRVGPRLIRVDAASLRAYVEDVEIEPDQGRAAVGDRAADLAAKWGCASPPL